MPILYESVYKPITLRARSVNRSLQQVTNAPYWQVTETYKVGAIYMTPAMLVSSLKDAVYKGAAQNNLKVLSFTILKTWAVYEVLYTDYYAQYQAIFASATSSLQAAPIPIGVIIIALAIIAGIVIILFIYFVERVIVPLFNWIPTAAKPYVATLLLVGLGLAVAGGGVYLIKSVIPKIHKK